jgi:hypothetical protein
MKAMLRNKTLHGDPAKTYVYVQEVHGILCIKVNKFVLTDEKVDILGLILLKQFKGRYLYHETITLTLSTFFKIHDFVRNTLIENTNKP